MATKLTVVFIVIIAAMLGLLVALRPHANATPPSAQANRGEPSTSTTPTQARPVPQQAPAPILPSWGRRGGTSAEGQPDPSWRNLSPWIEGGPPDVSPEGMARSRKMARDAYDHFVARAQLTPEQRERFDGVIRQYNKDYHEIAERIGKHDEPFTDEMYQKWNHDAYARVKTILTSDQYDVFLHEIGLGFGFVATFSRDY